MANPNPEIWGTVNSWVYSELAYGIEGTGARFAGYAKPMTANFGDGTTHGYRGSLLRAINVTHKMTLNEKLDRSICPCGQAPDVSPWGKIAIFNENSDLSTTPSRIITDTNNINWFLCDRAQIGNNARFFSKVYNNGSNGGLAFQQFAPLAYSPTTSANTCMRLTPYVYYGLRSFVATIQVHLLPKNGTYDDIVVNSIWVNLDSWVNYKDTHDLIGLRLFFRNCTAINASTLVLTYNTDTSQYGGEYSNQIAVIQDITVNNNGNNVETEFLSLNMQSGVSYRSGYIFDVCNVQNYSSTDNRRTNGVLPCWEYFDGQQIKRWKTTDNTEGGFWYTIPYSQENYDKIMKIAALFGCFFTPTSKYTFNYDMLDNDLYLPILDDNGIAHGEYTNGSNNANNSLYSKNSIREIDYDPDAPTPHNRYYDHTDLPTNGGTATNWYSDRTTGTLTPNMILGNLFNAIAEIADNPNNQQFLFQEPLKNILDYRRILLTQPWGDRPAGGTTVIPLGSFTTAGTEYPFTGYKNFPRFRRVTLGSFSFDREFNNFLDFEPYTQAILYVPYCGIKQLPMNIFAGHTVNIYMNADNTSGVLQVLIFVDNIEWGTLSGMASEELPLVGETALTAANTKRELDYQQGQLEWSKMIGIGGSVAGASISAANKNPAGLIAQGASALFKNYYYNTQQAELQYQINHTKPEPLTIQKGDSSIDKMNVQYPFIMIQSPVIIGGETPEQINAIMQTFGHTKGFKCCETGVIGDFSGLTKCSTANLNGISCTYTEKKMIMEALQEGVIL
jgi:hypothetical protein